LNGVVEISYFVFSLVVRKIGKKKWRAVAYAACFTVSEEYFPAKTRGDYNLSKVLSPRERRAGDFNF
jgi:hypothetical protein